MLRPRTPACVLYGQRCNVLRVCTVHICCVLCDPCVLKKKRALPGHPAPAVCAAPGRGHHVHVPGRVARALSGGPPVAVQAGAAAGAGAAGEGVMAPASIMRAAGAWSWNLGNPLLRLVGERRFRAGMVDDWGPWLMSPERTLSPLAAWCCLNALWCTASARARRARAHAGAHACFGTQSPCLLPHQMPMRTHARAAVRRCWRSRAARSWSPRSAR